MPVGDRDPADHRLGDHPKDAAPVERERRQAVEQRELDVDPPGPEEEVREQERPAAEGGERAPSTT